MTIKKEFPPNIAKIREVLNPPDTACFAYGDILYSPSTDEIFLDVMAHEMTHQRQQVELGPEKWWELYTELSLVECLKAIRDEHHFLP